MTDRGELSEAEREEARRRARGFDRIRQWGDPVLRTPAATVTDFDAALARQVAEMTAVVDDVGGAGIAAPQLGSLTRVIVCRSEPDGPVAALVNPAVEEVADETDVATEGCLSIGRATVLVDVPRPVAVTVTARTPDGAETRIEAEGGPARVLLHEIDHLDGVLMLERALPDHRRAALRALAAGEPWRPDDGDR
ncbi:MAG: peptide deformylase [Solirubrobacterales bacterium]|nr:peptide deformylase [Solirubrobacterales bacterium]